MQDREPGDPLIARALTFWDGLLDADRSVVPAAALTGAGRWTYVAGLATHDWFDRMERTLKATGGAVDSRNGGGGPVQGRNAVRSSTADAPTDAGTRRAMAASSRGRVCRGSTAGSIGT